MCTALSYRTKDFYFGRTLDYEFSYREEVTVTPRNYPIKFHHMGLRKTHYAIIGMAHVEQDYPLYYDAVNEKGLGMAGLNFVGNAKYQSFESGKENVAQYELILWILSQCATVAQAREKLEKINVTNDAFSEALPPAELHWMIADRKEAITLEVMEDGIHVHDNPAGVLANNPPFEYQMFALNNYMHLSPEDPENRFSENLPLQRYSRGMGVMGLPGDWSSQSRFIRAAFVKMNSVSGEGEEESVSQFFHILDTVNQTRGTCKVDHGLEITIYTSCCNADKGIYYYTSYENRQITAVDMHRCDLEGERLIRFPLVTKQQIRWEN